MGTYSGGAGTAGDPYQIGAYWDLIELSAVSTDWSAYFIVTEDIDFSASGGIQIQAIGKQTTPFTGSFDGQGHTFSNLTSTPTPDSVNHNGLFQKNSGTIKNITFTGYAVTGTSPNAGSSHCGLIGENAYGGMIQNVHLVNADIAHTHTNAHSDGSQYAACGGLVGFNRGCLCGCTTSGNLTFTATVGSYVGIGGIVGVQTGGGSESQLGYTANSSSTMVITNASTLPTAAYTYVGGIAGRCIISSTNRNYLSGNHFDGTITIVNTEGTGYLMGGGICGDTASDFYNNKSTGTVSLSSQTTTASGLGVGGCIGKIQAGAIIYSSYADASVSIGYNNIGRIGGFFGMATSATGATITNCYSKGSLYDLNTASTAFGGNARPGGFGAYIDAGNVTNCWSASAPFSHATLANGFAYMPAGTYSGLFWDTTTSGITAANTNATGKTTAQMQTQSTFTDYDFTAVTGNWKMPSNGGYPLLAWEDDGGLSLEAFSALYEEDEMQEA